jgi:hypothetical protein
MWLRLLGIGLIVLGALLLGPIATLEPIAGSGLHVRRSAQEPWTNRPCERGTEAGSPTAGDCGEQRPRGRELEQPAGADEDQRHDRQRTGQREHPRSRRAWSQQPFGSEDAGS